MVNDSGILTVDIGTESLKVAEFSVSPNGTLALDQFFCRKWTIPDAGESDSGVSQSDLAAAAFRSLFNEIAESGHFTAKRARISLPANSAFLRLSKLPDALGNREAIDRIVEYEAQQAVPCAMSDVEWDYQLVHHRWKETVEDTLDDGTVETSEVDREEYEALFVAIKREQITLYTEAIEDAGFKVVSVTIAPAALFNAAKATMLADDDQCAILLNLGGKSSSLVIADHNRVFVRSIPIAGNAITMQIAKEFGVTTEEAEELKRRHGFVAWGGAYDEPESEMAATISKIARNVMTRLHGEISRSVNVWRAQHGGSQPTKLLLSGGASVMPSLNDFFHEKLRMPVEYLNTFGAISLGDSVDRNALQETAPSFQELIGLALHEVIDCPIALSLLPREIRAQQRLDRPRPYFILCAIVPIAGLVLDAEGMTKQRLFSENRVTQAQQKLDTAKRVEKFINRELRDCNNARADFERAEEWLKARSEWISILEDIQRISPDMLWITSIEGIENPDQPEAKSGDNRRNGMNVAQVAAQKEIRALRISGYALIYRKQRVYMDFRKKLSESKWVAVRQENGSPAADIRDIINSDMRDVGGSNTSAFKCVVVLKEPIRK
ncbi:MAG: pilus assembly protein PilM [Victivallaceae bacterium]|nr:pilus assembly protein PilM [Victivallaceae bacterium]